MDKKYILYVTFIVVLIYIYYRNTILINNQSIKRPETFISLSSNKKPTLKLKFGTNFYFGSDKKERHHFQTEKQFIEYFLPSKYDYVIVNQDEKSDITIWDIYLDDNSQLRDDEINVLICVENVPHWNMYKHYTKYKEYDNNKMNIYLYNHIDSIVKTDKYLSLPLVHNYINYYKNNNTLEPSEYTNFYNKRFCLMINKSKLNPQISETVTALEALGQVDDLSIYPEILDKSCYHSVDLLNIFNKYKFVICFENSYADGYITEKIFNCFYAKTIPIYKGSEKIDNYINYKSFINARNGNYIHEVMNTRDNETLYNTYINSPKISKDYNDEDYNNELIKFIDNKPVIENYWSDNYIKPDSSEVYIVYFIYINPDKNWQVILEGQMNDLKDIKILQNNKLFVVISSSDENNTNEAKNIVNSILIDYNHNIEFTVEKENLYEYPGIKKVYDLALKHKDKLFIYFHSKGMVFYEENKSRNEIEEKLTKNTLKDWQKTISIFKNNSNIHKLGLYPADKGFVWFNFWWARGEYINRLEEPIITEDRYYYEIWLSKLKKVKCEDSYSTIYNGNACLTFDEINNGDLQLLQQL